jgi:hypothetical protein
MQFKLFWLSLCLENRPSLHGTAGIATPLQQVQSRPQQMSASSQVHFEHNIFSTKVIVDVFFALKHYHNCFYVEHLSLPIQDNKNDILSQRSLAPDSAMFGLPGTGHSKPAIHSPGLYLVFLVHHLIPSCFNSSWTPSTHVLAWDLLRCFCKAALHDPHFNMTNISLFFFNFLWTPSAHVLCMRLTLMLL